MGVGVEVERETTVPPEAVLASLRDPDPARRGEIWSNITPKHFELHDSGPDFIEVTEGTFLVGVFWERCRYSWSEPGSVIASVVDSNVFKPGSRTELHATARTDRGSRVKFRVRREFQRGFKGRVAARSTASAAAASSAGTSGRRSRPWKSEAGRRPRPAARAARHSGAARPAGPAAPRTG